MSLCQASQFIYCYAECRYAECRYAECRYAECRYAECRYAVCRYAGCRGAVSVNYAQKMFYNNCPGKCYKKLLGCNKIDRLALTVLREKVLLSHPER